MDWKRHFLERHAGTHSCAVSTAGRRHSEDRIWEGLSDDVLRTCPEGRFNSIVWRIWHMARCEDVAVNGVLRQGQEVLDQEGWLPCLGVTIRHIGTEATMAEVMEFSQQVDLAALRSYRAAVGRATRDWVETLGRADLDGCLMPEMVDPIVARGDLRENAMWVAERWRAGDWPKADYLPWLAIEHNWLHLGQASVTRDLLDHSGC